ncbi:MAG: tetratricopeptide (TPR) repeat protein [Pseudohongiellaceae bacterium]|jgi:tetratricopeptide (TPR) repeat protein
MKHKRLEVFTVFSAIAALPQTPLWEFSMLVLAALALVVPLSLAVCAQWAEPALDEGPGKAGPSAAEWLTLGAEALARGEPGEALPLLMQYRAENPQSSTGAFLLGVAQLDLGQPERAREELEHAVSLAPLDSAALSLLARVSFELGDGGRGLELLQEVVAIHPEDAASQTALGLAYFQLGEVSASYQAFMAAVDSDPMRPSAHAGLGRLLSAVGELEGAATAYRTALDLSGDQSGAGMHVSIGHVLRELDRPEEAYEHYLLARLAEPGDPWIAANVASTLYVLGRTAEAREPMEWAVSRLSGGGLDMSLVHLHHGLILEALGDLDGAVLALQAAVVAEPDFARAQRAFGGMLLDLGRRREAREQLAQGFVREALDDQLVLELALLHERFGDEQSARLCADALEAAAVQRPRASLALAELRLRSRQAGLRDAQAAEVDLRALSSGPLHGDAHAWALLGAALARRGALDEATAALDRGLALVADDGPVQQRFATQRARLVERARQR